MKKTIRNNYLIGSLFLVIPLIFFIELYFFPLFSIFKSAFQYLSREISINWQNIGNVFWFTLWQAIVSTILTLLAGFPAAWIFSRFNFPGKKILNALFTIPFILPTVVTASAFNALIGPRGLINMSWMSITGASTPVVQLMNTIWIILLAHVFYNTSVVIRVIGNSWSQIDARLEDAAKTLGASPWQVFFRVVFPQLKPAILSACLLIFLFDFTSYGVVFLLGGPKFRTIEVEIYYQALQMLNLPLSGILSTFQIVITIAVTLVDKRLSHMILINRAPRISGENMRKPESGFERIIIFLILFFQIVFLLSPILALFFRSLYIFPTESRRTALSPGWTSIYYQQLFINERSSIFFVPPIKAILNSLNIAVAASGISLLISLFIVVGENRYSWTSKLEPFFMIPIGTSAVTLGLGYLLYFGRDIQKVWLIPFAHSLIALPFVIRSIKPAIFNIPNSLRQAAAILGASPIQVFFKIDFPIILRGLINGFIFAFTISLGEFGATSFITRPDRPTIPIAIYRFLGQPGLMNYGQAMAMASILMIFCLTMVVVVDQKE